MLQTREFFRAIPVAITLVLFSAWSVRADLITTVQADVTQLGPEDYRYDYRLTNSPQSDFAAIALEIQVDPTAALSSITGPAGWDILYIQGDPAISWSSPDAVLDLQPGDSVSFSFESILGPAADGYSVFGFDSGTFGFALNSGQALSPSAVPEPSGFVLSLIGAVVLTGCGFARGSVSSRGTGNPPVIEPTITTNSLVNQGTT